MWLSRAENLCSFVMCRSWTEMQSWKPAAWPCLSHLKPQGRKQLSVLSGTRERWSKWGTDPVTKAATPAAERSRPVMDHHQGIRWWVSECRNGRGGSKQLSRKLRRSFLLWSGGVMLFCAQQLSGTKEVQEHQEINAFGMGIIILLRSSMAQEHLCQL